MPEWIYFLSVSRFCTWDDWYNRKIKTAALSHKLSTENLCEESILRKHSAIIQSRKNKNAVLYIFTNKTKQIEKNCKTQLRKVCFVIMSAEIEDILKYFMCHLFNF